MNGHNSNGNGQGPHPYGNGQPQWNQQWSTSPNPQHPNGVYPPPTSQASQPYPSTPTNGYPPPTNGTYPPPPTNGAYPPPTSQSYPPPHPQMGTTLPPISHETRPDMRYGYPPQPHPYGHGPPGGPPPPHGHMAGPYQHQQPPQPAPRQRTAIACRYCRRRKIRCSGFESSEDGRCTNCVRFAQECIFTPVSAQTQAFVPAHTVQRWGNGQPPALYGAYGQPLPPSHAAQPPAPQGQHAGYPLPSPTGPYPSPGASYSPGGIYDDRSDGDVTNSRKRLHPEHHSPTLPPPNPAFAAALNHSDNRSTYPEPTSLMPGASPGSSHASYPHNGGPYYTNPAPPQPQPPRRSSPQSNYSYDTNRTSSSPHASNAPSTPNSSVYPPFPNTMQASRADGRTPPPPTSQPPPQNGTDAKHGNGNTNGRPSMRINDLVENGAGRSSTDSDMLNALNRQRKA